MITFNCIYLFISYYMNDKHTNTIHSKISITENTNKTDHNNFT